MLKRTIRRIAVVFAAIAAVLMLTYLIIVISDYIKSGNNSLELSQSLVDELQGYSIQVFDPSVTLSPYSTGEQLSYSEGFPVVLSARYKIDGLELFYIKYGVIVMFNKNTAEKFLLAVGNSDVTLYDKDGKPLTDDDFITTGCYVEYKGEERFYIVSLGDLNGDGQIDDTDIKGMEAFIGNRPENAESDFAFLASDIDDSGNVTQYDIDAVLFAKEPTHSDYDMLANNGPIEKKNANEGKGNTLDVFIKKEDYKRKMKSPKYYGAEIKYVDEYSEVPSAIKDISGNDVLHFCLNLDKVYEAEDRRNFISRIELLDGVYEVKTLPH